MTIQDFCIRFRLPISTTSRLVRQIVAERTSAEYPELRKSADVGFAVDFEDLGLSASKKEGQSRTKYVVSDPDRLFRVVFDHFKYDVLTDKDLNHLVDAANFLYEVVKTDSPWVIVDGRNHRRFDANTEYFDTLRRVLARVGRK